VCDVDVDLIDGFARVSCSRAVAGSFEKTNKERVLDGIGDR
jgi:hypothetical protein